VGLFFILYDLVLVYDIVDCIVVMYFGKIVEDVLICKFMVEFNYFYICVFVLVILMILVML